MKTLIRMYFYVSAFVLIDYSYGFSDSNVFLNILGGVLFISGTIFTSENRN